MATIFLLQLELDGRHHGERIRTLLVSVRCGAGAARAAGGGVKRYGADEVGSGAD
jgi:hypothetical protein